MRYTDCMGRTGGERKKQFDDMLLLRVIVSFPCNRSCREERGVWRGAGGGGGGREAGGWKGETGGGGQVQLLVFHVRLV